MLISYWKVSIPFLDDAKLPKNLLGIKILSFYAYLKGLSWKNWRGGLTRLKFWSLAIKLNELESDSDKMKGKVDSLENFPIDTSLKTIVHSVL